LQKFNTIFNRSGVTDDRKRLYLRNPIRLDDVPIDDLNAVVFVLEYMVSIPLGAPSKPVDNYLILNILLLLLFRVNLLKVQK
jgi:hypothetical protein